MQNYIAIQSVLSLYASGRTSAVVLDIGHGLTSAVPIFDGYSIPHTVCKMNLAGRSLNEYLSELIV